MRVEVTTDSPKPNFPASPELAVLYARLLELCDELHDQGEREPRAAALAEALTCVLNAADNTPDASAVLEALAQHAGNAARVASERAARREAVDEAVGEALFFGEGLPGGEGGAA